MVTHDRWFLDAVCDRLWEVVPGHDGAGGRDPQPGHVEMYEGGYAAYILQRAERARVAQQAAEKRNNVLRKELAWLRRGAPARTSKPKFRIDAANELIANEPPPRDSIELARMATSRLGKDVVDVVDVDFGWVTPDGVRPVLSDVTLRLAPGERLGIVGANGAGKSSLLGLLSGALEPTSGRVKRGKTVKLAVLSQETKELDEIADRRVVEAVSDIATHVMVGKKEMTASQLVEKLGFTRERAWTVVGDLSGGERRRLQLLRLLVGSRMCCFLTNRRTIWIPIRWLRLRTCWIRGLARWLWCRTIGICWSGLRIIRLRCWMVMFAACRVALMSI